MINKIQKYLLLHYPMLWNIRLAPMLLILLATHLVFFVIGYVTTDNAFDRSYYYSIMHNEEMLYFVCILVSVLILVGWLVLYSRNNGFKILYPRMARHLYLEWILILIITIGITSLPYTLTQGTIFKWKSTATLAEAEEALALLDKAGVLIPGEDNDMSLYTYSPGIDDMILIPDSMQLDPDTLNLGLYSLNYTRNHLSIEGYIGPSFLYYKRSEYLYDYYKNNDEVSSDILSPESTIKIQRYEQVKQWLREGNKDSIMAVMTGFYELQQKHGMAINITPDKWFARIYKPPFFPVNGLVFIKNNQPYDYEKNATYCSYDNIVTEPIDDTDVDYHSGYIKRNPFLQHAELTSGYSHVKECYEYDQDMEVMLLLCICFALAISILIFAVRVTGGRFWLVAFVATGILFFIVCLVGVMLIEYLDWGTRDIVLMSAILFWVMLFVALFVRIMNKIGERKNKGRSNIYVNILLWLVPCLLPLLYFSYAIFINVSDRDILNMFWINVFVVVIIMAGISVFVRRWKSLPEE
ncbi:hypothetical protein [Dysgonomonas sp. 511]|uniref:hypothetical protein n=1 Tax=Dysgonomonas sp. 511 TaxID=2302930 RepID=UPI0013D2A3F9|nr:hypothetical protein [Dysgonomonas sp. 511]NDV78297.1 hypothetical protein [Dysgonomonas sp. 511]